MAATLTLHRFFRLSACSALSAALLFIPAHAAPVRDDPLRAWVAGDDPATLTRWVDARLAAAKQSLDKLKAVKGPRTVANTLQPFDDAQNQLTLASNQAYVLFAVGGTAALRDKAQDLGQKIAGEQTAVMLDPAVYRALAALPLPDKDAATTQYLRRTLLQYRLAGVDKDDATREKVRALQDQLTALSLTFARNVQDGVLTVTASRAELAGLPDDYIARHKPDAEGRYTLNTDEPDASPVFDFASDAGLRQRMFLAYTNRAYPANKPVLLDILAKRQELAGLLGYPSYADYGTADMMAGNAAYVRKLFADVDAASRETKQKEFDQLLAFAKSKQPGLTEITQADGRYWVEQYRRERYAFDAQSVRPYFPYEQVETGILATAGRIFNVSFVPVKQAKTWHPSVHVFEVIGHGKKLGRIYLDMHPREGKDKWFSAAPLVPGKGQAQLPEGMLICNFSGGVAGDPGLMQYDEVVTYFHEFGHLMHHILGSQHHWSGQGGFNVEGDFVEAPSQMLEAFFESHEVLAPFARHYQSGEVIPQKVVDNMNAASAFGRGRWAQGQLFYAGYSFDLHDRPTSQVDLDALLRKNREQFSPYRPVEGDHMYASFTHLNGYASNYYTYILDKVIAIDFFARFNHDHPLTGDATQRYIKAVIEPGATKPAATLVSDFLGRPTNMDAFKDWLGAQFKEQGKQ
ncbi:M3 family metallopeptidase [Chitinimonas sp.]|uniref:M3 family metallopeptidase n=1 Tax=Chitinimonas sp. TaxID=1934313 RepID=UPI002F91C7EC